VGVTTSQPAAVMIEWLALPNRRYERLATATLGVIGNRKLRGPVDLDKVMYIYTTRYLKLPNADDGLPDVPEINLRALRSALRDAYNDKNGAQVQRFEEILV